MGLHSFLAKHHMYYGSPESIEFTSVYFMLLNYWSLVASNKIAKERKELSLTSKTASTLTAAILTNIWTDHLHQNLPK